MGATPNEKVMQEYAWWVATPKRLRTSLSLPKSKKAFAEFKGISERSLYRWEKDEKFQRLIEQRKVQLAGNAPNAAVSAAVGGPQPYTDARATRTREGGTPVTEADDPVHRVTDDPDEAQYLKVKSTLAGMAADGNQGAMDLFLKHYGKPYIEAERSDLSPFADLDDGALLDRVLSLIGAEFLADWLSRQMVPGEDA